LRKALAGYRRLVAMGREDGEAIGSCGGWLGLPEWGGADPLHVVAIHEIGGSGEGGVRGGVDEILLHFVGGREGDEHVRGRAASGESVRDAARGEDGLSGAESQATIADLEAHFAFHDVEPFFLREMQMQSRAGVGHEIAVLDDEKVARRVRGDDLEGERAETEGVEMAGPVLTGRDGMED